MKRIEVIQAVAARQGLVICTLGLPSRELYSLSDKPCHFYMLGSMGMASSIGLGLALAQKKRVYVVDGDGSLLMNLGSLATIAGHAPKNYCLVVVDNKGYGSTGHQPSPTAGRTDLAQLARAAGIERVCAGQTVSDLEDCLDRHRDECLVIIAETDASSAEVPHVPLLPHCIARRFKDEVMRGDRSSLNKPDPSFHSEG
jgi:sulfopyruvate decarboxylase subunit beta